jgi:hypothetical protein
MYPLKFSDKGLPTKPRIEKGEILAEREGFDLPQILQVIDFRRHRLKYA